jgi:hypothetical protein
MLVQRHHEEQKLLARHAVAELAPLWQILDFHDLRKSTPPWLKAVRPVIEKGYLTSQYVAAQFVQSYRSAELPVAEPLGVEVPNPYGVLGLVTPAPKDTQLRIIAAMQATGPAWLAKNSKPGMDVEDIPDLLARGFSKSAGAATRLILNGGRGMVRSLLDVDKQAVGIQAVADDNSCKSCRYLSVTRLLKGVNTERQLDAVAVGHDFCTCSARLLY